MDDNNARLKVLIAPHSTGSLVGSEAQEVESE